MNEHLLDRLHAESENYGLHEDVRALMRDAIEAISDQAALPTNELIAAARDVERRAGPDREPRLRAALAALSDEAAPAGDAVAWVMRNSRGKRIAMTDDERAKQPAWVLDAWKNATPVYLPRTPPADQRQEGECDHRWSVPGEGRTPACVRCYASPPPEAASPVGGLVAKWRADAERVRRDPESFNNARLEGYTETLDECADELEAALASPTVAPVSGDGDCKVRDCVVHGCQRPDLTGADCPGRCQLAALASPTGVDARPLSEWHEDFGPAVWWAFPVVEPAWIGSPDDSDWPGYHTHWTPHPPMPAALAARDGGTNG